MQIENYPLSQSHQRLGLLRPVGMDQPRPMVQLHAGQLELGLSVLGLPFVQHECCYWVSSSDMSLKLLYLPIQ